MNLTELLFGQSRLIGEEVALFGYLISHNETYVVGSAEDIDSDLRVLLPHSIVQAALLDQVDCLVGGAALYMDHCRVQGVLAHEFGALVIHPRTIEIIRPQRPVCIVTIEA